MEADVFTTLQLFFTARAVENWGMSLRYPQFWLGNIQSCDALGQWRGSTK